MPSARRIASSLPVSQETAIPLTTTLPAERHFPLGRVAAAAAVTCVIAGAAAVTIPVDEPATQAPLVGQSTAGINDLEADKAAALRTLGLSRSQQQPGPSERFFDLQANKARGMGAR